MSIKFWDAVEEGGRGGAHFTAAAAAAAWAAAFAVPRLGRTARRLLIARPAWVHRLGGGITSEMKRLRKDFERGSAETGNVREARRPEPGGETRERDKKGGERVAEPSGMPETRRWLHSELSHSLGVRSDEREPCP
uniref:Uncharacterized protein n=1 Tax=Oryza nivara TaxID=4536 RepID=A0A0E0FIE7_ORYNI